MVKNEPVLFAGLARLVVIIGAKFGFNLDATQVVELFVVVEGVLVPLVRHFVHPAAKVEAQIGAARAEGMAIGAARGPS
jgi:hypothetical protein